MALYPLVLFWRFSEVYNDVKRDSVDNDVVMLREYVADDVADSVDVLVSVVFG